MKALGIDDAPRPDPSRRRWRKVVPTHGIGLFKAMFVK
jgi:hypothetical protein